MPFKRITNNATLKFLDLISERRDRGRLIDRRHKRYDTRRIRRQIQMPNFNHHRFVPWTSERSAKHSTADDVSQLPNIAGPIGNVQSILSAGGESDLAKAQLASLDIRKMGRQQRNVFAAITQWRYMQRENREPMKQIGPKPPPFYLGCNVA